MTHLKSTVLAVLACTVFFTGQTRLWAQADLFSSSISQPAVKAPMVITIDPGHGGHDFGAVGPSGLKEKDVVMNMALLLKKALGGNVTVRLTRDGDYSVDAEKRQALSNFHRSHIFISLHAGGGFNHTAKGMTVFYHTNKLFPSQKIQPDEHKDTAPSWHDMQTVHSSDSKRLAKLVQERLAVINKARDRGTYQAPLFSLEGVDAPAILIELGYLSHPAEEKRLKNQAALEKMARAIARGIQAYCREVDGCNEGQEMVEEDLVHF